MVDYAVGFMRILKEERDTLGFKETVHQHRLPGDDLSASTV